MFGGKSIQLTNNKNIAYTLWFVLYLTDDGAPSFSGFGSYWSTLQISKDGGSFTTLTNTPVSMGNGWWYINLTANEMNADTVRISIVGAENSGGTWASACAVEIQTHTVDLTSSVNTITSLTNTNPSIQEVLSLLWLGMTNEATKKNWDLQTFLKKWTF